MKIGFSTTGKWAAVWKVGTPYINVYSWDFFWDNRRAILNFARYGGSYASEIAESGAFHCIKISGDLNDFGWPLGYDNPSEYVAQELQDWAAREGGAYSLAE